MTPITSFTCCTASLGSQDNAIFPVKYNSGPNNTNYTCKGRGAIDSANTFDLEMKFRVSKSGLNALQEPPFLVGKFKITYPSNNEVHEGVIRGTFDGKAWTLNPSGFATNLVWTLSPPQDKTQ